MSIFIVHRLLWSKACSFYMSVICTCMWNSNVLWTNPRFRIFIKLDICSLFLIPLCLKHSQQVFRPYHYIHQQKWWKTILRRSVILCRVLKCFANISVVNLVSRLSGFVCFENYTFKFNYQVIKSSKMILNGHRNKQILINKFRHKMNFSCFKVFDTFT